MAGDKQLGLDELLALARRSAAVEGACACILDAHDEWAQVQASFPEQDMRPVGTLVEDPYVEATFAEFHPDGTRYWSAAAPIALRHYPYNRCTVVQCAQCGRAYLRYLEAGGYYAEPRVRALKPDLIVDAPV